MANGLPVTPGSGAFVASDTVGSASPPATNDRLQYVKIDLGAAGASSPAVGSLPVNITGGTTGGATPFRLLAAASTNATSVKASAGQISSGQFINRNTTTTYYVHFYNKASSPTVGTDTIVKSICIPAAQSTIQPTEVLFQPATPIAFSTGIALSITAGTDLATDTQAVLVANDVTCQIDYN